MPAVVGIIATTARAGGNDPFHDFLERMYGSGSGGATSETPVRGIGTGFFIRSDGLIATNGHVIEGATDITVQVGEDERVYRATLVGQDDATDFALLKVDGEKPFAGASARRQRAARGGRVGHRHRQPVRPLAAR